MNRNWKGLFLGFVCACSFSLALGQSLDTDINPATSFPQAAELSESEREQFLEPVLAWLSEARAATSEGAATEPTTDLRLISRAARFKLADRDLATEYLARIPDERLIGVFDHGRASSHRASASYSGRLRVADEILLRQATAVLRAEAIYDRGYVTLISTNDLTAAAAEFSRIAKLPGSDDEWALRSQAAANALRQPEAPADFAEARSFLDLFVERKQFESAIHESGVILLAWNAAQQPSLHPSQQGGSLEPALAVMQAAGIRKDSDALVVLENDLNSWVDLTPEQSVRLRSGLAGLRVGRNEYDEAITQYQVALEFGLLSRDSALAAFQIAQCHWYAHRHREAAGAFLDFIELFGEQEPDLKERAERSIAQLVETNQLTMDDAREAAARLRDGRQRALATSTRRTN